MKTSRETKGARAEPSPAIAPRQMNARRSTPDSRPAFTLIELMVVIGIMGLILASGIPSILRVGRKEGMRKATSDVTEVCNNARAQAILWGTERDVMFHPMEKRLEIRRRSGESPPSQAGDVAVVESPSSPAGEGQSAQLADDISIEMLDINLLQYRESESARVRFFPNGTSDEFTLILHSGNNEWRKISLEVTTGLSSVDDGEMKKQQETKGGKRVRLRRDTAAFSLVEVMVALGIFFMAVFAILGDDVQRPPQRARPGTDDRGSGLGRHTTFPDNKLIEGLRFRRLWRFVSGLRLDKRHLRSELERTLSSGLHRAAAVRGTTGVENEHLAFPTGFAERKA